mmetsp:Transcript_19442/g.37545  ORF Transcript_19442/g.37545 Transcript_19442/m.37545 type:complete len:92 (-) Transcript_19442:344-619(-)
MKDGAMDDCIVTSANVEPDEEHRAEAARVLTAYFFRAAPAADIAIDVEILWSIESDRAACFTAIALSVGTAQPITASSVDGLAGVGIELGR